MKNKAFATCTLVCLLGTPPTFSQNDSEIANRYRSAKTPEERMTVCIDAINQKFIAKGKNIRDINLLFGQDVIPPILQKPQEGERLPVWVFFDSKTIRKNSKPNQAAALSGWYLYCLYDCNMKIRTYHISNSPDWSGY